MESQQNDVVKILDGAWIAMCSNGDQKENAAKTTREAIEKIEEEIKGKKFFGGEDIGYLDLALGWISYWLPIWEEVGDMQIFDRFKCPSITAWINNFLNHPIIKQNLPPRDKMLVYFHKLRNELSYTFSASDREALLDFKSGLQDPHNVLSSWSGANCCEWYGIRCNNNTGAVVSIDLHNPYVQRGRYESYSDSYEFDYDFDESLWSLSGNISPSLMKLKSLRHLDLSFNQFNGIPIPDLFGSLENLQYLNLSHAGFRGTIPPNLRNLSHLEILDLHDFGLYVADLQWLRGLISLEHLVMNEVNLSLATDWFSTLNQLPSIVELHLSYCELFGNIPSPTTSLNFTSLAVIDLSYNNFRSVIPDWFVNISSLQYIDMSHNKLYGRIPLGLGEIPVWFGDGFSHLRILVLRSNSFTGEILFDLSKLNSLQVLDLADNYLNGSIPPSLCDLKTMSQEQRINTFFGHGMPGKSYEESLDVNMKGMFLKYTKTLSLVTSIDLSRNNLSGRFPQELTKLSGLVALNLSINHLTGIIPESISNMHQLSSLDLSSNHFSGSIPPSLSSLSFLGYLNLSDNSLSGAIPYTVGLLVPYLILAMKRSWSDVYFDFVDLIIYKLLVKIHRRRINNGRKSNKLRHRR
ncbi:receptor-like protein EIX1 [Senna tora]|uniref:glutathione transferase n=1 Tax=Senna tora TaxID=362788 RepID=A0A834W2N4_9FABA|nr:receptor-like protein EIX1 [Senna tora]